MNHGLTPAAERSPFYATTTSLAGLLLSVFTTLAVLVSVSMDQTGASLAEVTSSFRGSLHENGRNDAATIFAAFRRESRGAEEQTENPRSGVSVQRHMARNDLSPAITEEEETGRFSNEQSRPTDVNGPVFTHLMTELQRHYQVSPAAKLGGELAFDLHSQKSQSRESIHSAIERILKVCRKPSTSIQSPAEFEVIVWASTPSAESLATASKDAFALEQSLEMSIKPNPNGGTTIRSSGRIWTQRSSPRPLATFVVRAADR